MQNNDYLTGFSPVNANFDELFSNGTDSETELMGIGLTLFSRKQGKTQPDHKKSTMNEKTQVNVNNKVRTGCIDVKRFEDFKDMLCVDFYRYKVLDDQSLDNFFTGPGFNTIPRNDLIELALIMLYFIDNAEYEALASEAKFHFRSLLKTKHLSSSNEELEKALQKGKPTTRISGILMLWYYVSVLSRKKVAEIG